MAATRYPDVAAADDGETISPPSEPLMAVGVWVGNPFGAGDPDAPLIMHIKVPEPGDLWLTESGVRYMMELCESALANLQNVTEDELIGRIRGTADRRVYNR